MCNLETQTVPVSQLAIDHVAIAVRDLDAAVDYYERHLGFEVAERRETHGDATAMRSVVVRRENLTFVLLQGTDEASSIARYVEAYGPGVHHIALHTDDVRATVADFEARGAQFSTRVVSAPGLKQTFTVRDPNSGIMLEIIQRHEEQGFDDGNVAALFRDLERSDTV